MPAVMITRPSPSENSPNRPIRLAVLAMLTGDRKRGLISATMAPTTTIRTRRPRSFFSIGLSSAWLIRINRLADGELHHIVLTELIAAELAADLAFMHDEDAIAHTDHLFHVARYHQHSTARVGEGAYQTIDFALGPAVDSPGRLIEQHDIRRHRQPFGKHALLLVAARQRPRHARDRWCPDVE